MSCPVYADKMVFVGNRKKDPVLVFPDTIAVYSFEFFRARRAGEILQVVNGVRDALPDVLGESEEFPSRLGFEFDPVLHLRLFSRASRLTLSQV